MSLVLANRLVRGPIATSLLANLLRAPPLALLTIGKEHQGEMREQGPTCHPTNRLIPRRLQTPLRLLLPLCSTE